MTRLHRGLLAAGAVAGGLLILAVVVWGSPPVWRGVSLAGALVGIVAGLVGLRTQREPSLRWVSAGQLVSCCGLAIPHATSVEAYGVLTLYASWAGLALVLAGATIGFHALWQAAAPAGPECPNCGAAVAGAARCGERGHRVGTRQGMPQPSA